MGRRELRTFAMGSRLYALPKSRERSFHIIIGVLAWINIFTRTGSTANSLTPFPAHPPPHSHL
jgi:hypothetical protein